MRNLASHTHADAVFPYGTVAVDPTIRHLYDEDYERASWYPLPALLPRHHPLLTCLEGDYASAYDLPPWWQQCIASIQPVNVRNLLATASASEFRTGCIEQHRWKRFRDTLSPEERRTLPSSPKIAALLDGTDWFRPFQIRGSTLTPEQFTLRISTRPLDFLYMSNGDSWDSCQHFARGSENYRLPGNFYDTSVAVAMLLPRGASVRDTGSVLARTTLRVFQAREQFVVALGRIYHNNETLVVLLLRALARLLDARSLRWGFLVDTNALSFCEDGDLGPALRQRLDAFICVESEPSWLPAGWYVPYVDGGDKMWWEDEECTTETHTLMQLKAMMRLLRPFPHPPTAVRPHEPLARLIATGSCPPVH